MLSVARRLKTTEVGTTRTNMLVAQHGRCAICGLPCAPQHAVLDHDHGTGAVRGTLHRGCNSLLGKLENNAARYGVRDIGTFTNGVAAYLRTHLVNVTGLLHPTHKTDDEKRERRNAKARVARAKRKESA
jgi:hypothetical protein